MISSSSVVRAAITTAASSSKALSRPSPTTTTSRRSPSARLERPHRLAGTGSSVANCAPWNQSYLTDPEAVRALAASQNVGGSVWVLPNKITPPHSDQFDLGVRKRFGDIQTSLTLSHIRSRNLFMFTRANFFENGWYTRTVMRTPVIKDADGNYVSGGVVTGCANGGDAWI